MQSAEHSLNITYIHCTTNVVCMHIVKQLQAKSVHKPTTVGSHWLTQVTGVNQI